MTRSKVTGKAAARSASKILRDGRTSKDSKSSAGSALSQRKAPNKTTSRRVASQASRVLNDKSKGKHSKKVAGSALSQKKRQ